MDYRGSSPVSLCTVASGIQEAGERSYCRHAGPHAPNVERWLHKYMIYLTQTQTATAQNLPGAARNDSSLVRLQYRTLFSILR